jgi:hypothetical protein
VIAFLLPIPLATHYFHTGPAPIFVICRVDSRWHNDSQSFICIATAVVYATACLEARASKVTSLHLASPHSTLSMFTTLIGILSQNQTPSLFSQTHPLFPSYPHRLFLRPRPLSHGSSPSSLIDLQRALPSYILFPLLLSNSSSPCAITNLPHDPKSPCFLPFSEAQQRSGTYSKPISRFRILGLIFIHID